MGIDNEDLDQPFWLEELQHDKVSIEKKMKKGEESSHKIKHEESSHKFISMRSLHITLNVRSLCIDALNKVHTKTVGNRALYLLSCRGAIKKLKPQRL